MEGGAASTNVGLLCDSCCLTLRRETTPPEGAALVLGWGKGSTVSLACCNTIGFIILEPSRRIGIMLFQSTSAVTFKALEKLVCCDPTLNTVGTLKP
jgi:hypothetical protein